MVDKAAQLNKERNTFLSCFIRVKQNEIPVLLLLEIRRKNAKKKCWLGCKLTYVCTSDFGKSLITIEVKSELHLCMGALLHL